MRLLGSRTSTSLPAAPGSGCSQSIRQFGPPDSERESHCLSLGGFVHRERTTQHNTPKHEIREVCYRWHPLFGKSIIVHGQLIKRGCHLFRYLLPGQQARIGCEIPAWMLDPVRCAAMQLKAEPHVSWRALLSLQQLWKEALEPARALRQSAGNSPAGSAYEQKTKQPSSESVRSGSQAATVARSPSTDPASITAAVGPTLKQPRRSQVRRRKEGRSR